MKNTEKKEKSLTQCQQDSYLYCIVHQIASLAPKFRVSILQVEQKLN